MSCVEILGENVTVMEVKKMASGRWEAVEEIHEQLCGSVHG
jgi:hypothetical protein